MVHVSKSYLAPTANQVGAGTFHLSDPSMDPPFNSTLPITNQEHFIQLELSEIHSSFIEVLFLLQLLLLYCSVEAGFQFLICRP